MLLSDIGMPEEDGYDLIRKVRALSDDEGGQTPAVALTGYITSEEGERLRGAGFQLHLAKPVELNNLLEGIVELAGLRQSAEC